MSDLRDLLSRAVDEVVTYRDGLGGAHVAPRLSRAAARARLDAVLQDDPLPLDAVLDELLAGADGALMASSGPRYFGFVVGGALEAALVADVVATGWDQNAYNEALSPAALAFEDVAGGWLKELFRIPAAASVGFVTGGQGGNTVGLATARWEVLRRHGWDVGRDGLVGAPPVRVLTSTERHATVDRALRLLGHGERAIVEVPATANGAMDPEGLAAVMARIGSGPTIVCAQAGNVNTGAFDDLAAIGPLARDAGAWLHVDGAFGLWAGASRRTAHLVAGLELADSASCDGHKWLNVPYDAGYAFCLHPEAHAAALSYSAAYLTGQVEGREFGGGDLVLESSRRARGFATWAALRSLGRRGVEDLVDRCCTLARRFAEGLAASDGIEIVNDVVLNQVLVRVGDLDHTERVARAIHDDGTCWLGATTWGGERLLRTSVSNWSTTEADVDASVDAIVRACRASA